MGQHCPTAFHTLLIGHMLAEFCDSFLSRTGLYTCELVGGVIASSAWAQLPKQLPREGNHIELSMERWNRNTSFPTRGENEGLPRNLAQTVLGIADDLKNTLQWSVQTVAKKIAVRP